MLRLFAVLALGTALLVSCGGDDDEADAEAVGEEAAATSSPTPEQPASGDETNADGSDPSGDLGTVDLPEPGQIRLEAGGDTFVFTAQQCEVDQAFVVLSGSVTTNSQQIDLAANANKVGDQWATGINVIAAQSDIRIQALGDAVDAPAIDGATVMIEADFVSGQGEELNDSEELGRGRLTANCG